ncbi:hypothetical protein B179_00070 [Corynebacterium diphtheriae str. Aberdeen]|nr:hypothetical protein B179_00070 [Corynebacterium diphtheriae str. Aberdeen]
MIIPVAVMQCVAVAIVNVVNVVAVRNCHMATVRAMLVLMVGVGVMLGGFHTHPSGRHARGAGGHREHSQRGRREELPHGHSSGRAGGCGSRELRGS